jgi:polysaccharide biosynthesis transport protein
MSDETDGLIERAAALLRQPGSLRPKSNSAGDHPRSHSLGGRADHVESRTVLGRSGPPAAFDGDSRPMPAPVVLEEEEWRLKHLFRAASLHKVTLVVTTLLCFVAAAVAILSLTPRYSATAVVAVGNPEPSVITGIETNIDGRVVQLSPDEAAVNTQVDYLRSRPVAERAMDYLHLWNLPEFEPSAQPHGALDAIEERIGQAMALFRQWHAELSGNQLAASYAESELARHDAAIDKFLSKLTVDAQPKSQVITVRFEDPDPEIAAAAANAVADQYIARQISMASAAAQRATTGLEQAVTALRQRVAQSDQAYEQYRGAFEAHSSRQLLGKETEQAGENLAQAEVARQVLEARLGALRSLAGRSPIDDATSEVTGSRVMQALHEQAADLQGQLAELSTTLGNANPRIEQLRAAIGRADREMRAEVARQTAAVAADLKVAIVKEASLRQGLATTRSEAAQSSPGQAKLDALKVEAEANRAVLNAFLTRLHEANTSAKLLQRANAEVVTPASVPLGPTFPKTKLLLALAAVASTMAGFGAAVAREKAAPTFRSGEEIEIETGVRTLALLPLIDNPDASPEEAFASPASVYGEAIRTLYMTLLLRQRLKVFAVTSARTGDGKTTMAAGLALIAAKAGRKVLLIDADLCTAGASRIFQMTGHEGLAEVIGGSREVAEVVAAAGATPNFHFLAAGATGNVLAARSGLDGIFSLLRRLREEYDLIVIDSPPVLAVADAMALSAHADATLFAVRWGSTPRASVKLGLKRLNASGQGSPVGVALTMVDSRKHSRFGYTDSALYAKDLVGYYAGSDASRA